LNWPAWPASFTSRGKPFQGSATLQLKKPRRKIKKNFKGRKEDQLKTLKGIVSRNGVSTEAIGV
jgi:hypothetical protein